MEEWYVGKRGVQCERKVGRERGKRRKRAANQIYDEKAAMGTESGGTCKATMKAHNLNGSSCFVLIAVRMSRRFPWVIAASVSVKSTTRFFVDSRQPATLAKVAKCSGRSVICYFIVNLLRLIIALYRQIEWFEEKMKWKLFTCESWME